MDTTDLLLDPDFDDAFAPPAGLATEYPWYGDADTVLRHGELSGYYAARSGPARIKLTKEQWMLRRMQARSAATI